MRTQPIAMDHRKEVNNIRRELTAGGKSKDRSSPSSYGTPKGLSRSPLSSPLVGYSSQAILQCLKLANQSAYMCSEIRAMHSHCRQSGESPERGVSFAGAYIMVVSAQATQAMRCEV